MDTTLFHNALGLFVIIAIWLIFSVIGLRGVSQSKSIKEIRQETGFSLLSLTFFVLALIGIVVFIFTNRATPNPIPS